MLRVCTGSYQCRFERMECSTQGGAHSGEDSVFCLRFCTGYQLHVLIITCDLHSGYNRREVLAHYHTLKAQNYFFSISISIDLAGLDYLPAFGFIHLQKTHAFQLVQRLLAFSVRLSECLNLTLSQFTSCAVSLSCLSLA